MEPTATPFAGRTAYERSTHSRTLGDMFLRTTVEHEGVALRYRNDDGAWVDVTYTQLGALAREIARGLIALGIAPGDKVAILSNTRPEWTYADAGVMCAGATAAPIYHTNSPGECEYVLEHSDSVAVFCEDQEQLDKIAAIRDRLPHLEHVIAFAGSIPGSVSLDDLRELGGGVPDSAVEERVEHVDEGHIATYVYTSGTTGPPKACMMTHANWISTMRMYEERLELADSSTVFMFLPLAHSLARIIQMLVLDVGATLAFWQRDPLKLLDDIKETGPTHFPSVPRVFEKIHTAAEAGIEEQNRLKRALIRWSLDTGRKARRIADSGEPGSRFMRWQLEVADKIVLSKVRALFGENLVMALVGAAPMPRETLEFFDACGIRVLEGWGMTETTAAGTLNTNEEYRSGSVGRALPGVDVSVADDGEVLLRGPNVFAGYYKNDDATRETIVDGWLHTGDLGSISDGYLSITGRKKDIIITSSGKNITPVNIENALKATRWISEAVVYGDNRSYLVAIITLDPDEAPKLAEKLGVPAEPEAMAGDPAVIGEIQSVVDEANERFARIEQVKRFAILDHQLTQAEGELTPTLKVKRAVVYERYAPIFESLYSEEGRTES
jgi:long-chain acyl-CoA synthetase